VVQVTESVASLQAALSAVRNAFDANVLEEDAVTRLRYIQGALSVAVNGDWVSPVGIPSVEALAGWPAETASEAGAKFSAATRAAILSMADTLKGLLGTQPDDADKTALTAAVDEINDSVEAMIKEIMGKSEPATESLAAITFSSMTFVQEGTVPADAKYRMFVIREGLSGNRNNWTRPVLEAATASLNNRPIFLDHARGSERGAPEPRSLADRVGWWSDPAYVKDYPVSEGVKASGIIATANILRHSAHSWVNDMIKESLERNMPELVGVSVDAAITGKVKTGSDGKMFRDIESIVGWHSADLVATPGAGGQPLAVLEGLLRDEEIMALEDMTLESLREARPELYEAIVAQAKEGMVPVTEATPPPPAADPPPAPADDKTDAVTETLTRIQQIETNMKLTQQAAVVEAMLITSVLPEEVRKVIRTEIGTTELRTVEELQATIDKYVSVARTLVQESQTLTNTTLIPFRGSVVMEGQNTPLDQVMNALDDWFGAGDPAKKGTFRPIESMRQFYQAVTGDYDFNGVYNAKESAIGSYLDMRVTEALPGQTHIVGGSTITLPSLFGLSMNRALTKKYAAQRLWWEPVVEKKRLNNFKEQERTRLHSFGSLTQRTVGTEEYVELDWAETKEVYTPTGYGNVVPVNRRGFINDDMEGIRRIPTLLGESAGYTINEVVAALFTANSGAGVALTDTFAVFHANHQGNLGSAALDQASLEAAIVLVSGMTNDASKAIGWQLKHLLVPNTLMPTAYRLTQSQQTPGTANNDPNFIASQWGVSNVIYVPQFNADANNWYAMADPSEITLIEVGFILGQEEPAMFVQNGPTEGIVFTNDVINYKVRHEYGADFIDYRGAYGAVVA
jgi:hypothetical protein